MRFWISAIIGIIILSGLSTALVLWNPDQFTVRPPSSFKPKPIDPFVGQKLPKLEFDTKRIDVPNVQQMTSGESVFHLRNEGESELQLRLGSKSCTCMAIRIDKGGKTYTRFAKTKQLEDIEKQKAREKDPNQKDKISEAVEGEGNIDPASVVTLAPGEEAEFIIEWDSKDTVGIKRIGADVFSNDPRADRKSVNFDLQLNIVPELLFEPAYLSFGQLRENQKREESLKIFSMVHEDLTVEYTSSSHPAISAAVRPMNEDENSNKKAKAGYVITVTINGKLPVGDMNERVMFTTNLKQQPEVPITVAGMVDGNFEVNPGSVNFGVVTSSGNNLKKVFISAKALPPEESLVVDASKITVAVDGKPITNDFIGATIRRHPDSTQLWELEVTANSSSSVGKFFGHISVTDSKGEPLLTVAFDGVISGSSKPK